MYILYLKFQRKQYPKVCCFLHMDVKNFIMDWGFCICMDEKNIRDFVYVDIERLKSIISQLEEGLVVNAEESRGDTLGTNANAGVGIYGLLKGEVEAEVQLHKNISETKSLHDYIYNKVEATLLDADKLHKIPSDNYNDPDSTRDSLTNTSFILIEGYVNINDFKQLRELLENFGDLSLFLAKCQLDGQKFKKARDQKTALSALTSKLEEGFDENMRSGLILFFDMFYKDRITIKSMPYEDNSDFRFVGNLNPKYLRDDISSIIYKYGTAPISKWTIFAQVASIPPSDRSNEAIEMQGAPIESALQGIFDAYREFELLAQSVMYPEIAITPIAIYRE